jgi:putative redox protein
MATELVVHAVHQGGLKFAATTGDHSVTLDYPFPPGHVAEGPTPLQMILTSLAVCSGSTLALVLGKMKQPLEGLEVTARGTRSDTHPTVLTEISLEFVIRGTGIKAESVEQALTTAEERLCPVWAMLKPGTPIAASFQLLRD